MLDVLEKFKQSIKTDGVSQSDIKMLEDTVGDKFITSTVNIKHFTTERSSLGIGLLEPVLSSYHDELVKETKTVSISDIVCSYSNLLMNLNSLRDTVVFLTNNYNKEIKETMLNAKCRFSYIDSEGMKSDHVYEVFGKDYNMGYLLDNENLLKEICGETEYLQIVNAREEFYSYVKQIEQKEYWSFSNSFNSFLSMSLIINKELKSYIEAMNFTPQKMEGKDLIEFLDSSYEHYEYINTELEYYSTVYRNYIKSANSNNNIYGVDINKIERIQNITKNIDIFNRFLFLVKKILISMSNH